MWLKRGGIWVRKLRLNARPLPVVAVLNTRWFYKDRNRALALLRLVVAAGYQVGYGV